MHLKIRDIRVQHGQTCLSTIDQLELAPGQKLILIGSNGSGKTSLLRAIAGFQAFTAELFECPFGPRQICYVHQKPFMFNGSVKDNLQLPKRFSRSHSEQSSYEQRCQQLLSQFEWKQPLTQDAQSLSGGEKRRIAIIRALLSQPKLLLLDEPFSDVDDHGRSLISKVLLSETYQQMSMILSSPTKDLIPTEALHCETVTLRKNDQIKS